MSIHQPSLAKISIITVSYNAVTTLAYTIDSILQQTYKNIEYIIIDGASTDGTLDIIKSNEQYINQWISEPDKGIYDAMNKGLSMATGDYIIFMNAGDEFYDTNTLKNIFANNDYADIYYGQTKLIDTTRKEVGERWLIAPEKGLNWKSFKKGMLVSHQAILVKRSIVPFFDTKYKLSADVDWVIACLKRSSSIVYTNHYVCKYLINGASKQNQSLALKERFLIMAKHYGLLSTLLYHIYFIIRLPFRGN